MTVPPVRSQTWRWWIAGLLLLATTINYMDRMTLANASGRVIDEFGLSKQQYGNIEVAFGWAFGIGALFFGFLADRVRVYLLYPAILAAWSVVGFATGLTEGYAGLLLCRTLLGFFEAGHWPCALKTTYAVLSEKDRTMGNSILQSGASIGAIITPQIMKYILAQPGGSWRTGFLAIGVVGLLWAALWFISLRPRDLQSQAAPPLKTDTKELWAILRGGRFWALALLVMGIQVPWHIFRVWLTPFLQIGRRYGEAAALNFNSVYFIATDLGCLLAGAAAAWLVRRGSPAHDARRTVFVGACLLTSLSVFIPKLGHGWPLLCTLLLIGAGALALYPCYYSFTQELTSTHIGRITGLLALWVWSLTSPIHSLFGYIIDRTGSFDVLAVAGLTPWLGVLAMKLLWREPARGAGESVEAGGV
ncbi:MAG TPA: MFS transporter [Chthoniobacteraceae bacterium]|jgi:ACS family hexuronate transporter-like MFS transporter|nr:MFS transporter [Chthoniobacteraceae bacterium]